MRRTSSLLGLLSLLGACSPASPPPPSPPAHPAPSAPASAKPAVELGAIVTPDPDRAPTAADWLALADEAQKQGVLDVANACRGRAYALTQSPQTLLAWIDGLLGDGERDLARRVWADTRATALQKGGADIVRQIEGHLNGLPRVQPPSALAPSSVPAPLRAAYEIEGGGRPDDAATAFENALGNAPDPFYLAHTADLWWQKGDKLRARRGWSSARVLYREAGAGFELVPVRTWYTRQATFVGGKLALVRFLQPIDSPSSAMSEVSLWSFAPAVGPVIRFRAPSPLDHVVFLEDGLHLLHEERGTIVMRDMLSGVEVKRFETGEKELGIVIASGAGDALHVLGASGSRVGLWNRKGEPIGKYELEGTTPTITRVYRAGHGTRHDNILKDAPTWAVSAAISPDRRFVAAGGSDSKVRLFDRRTGQTRLLSFTWSYEERRLMGGNPDLNEPLDMRFSAKGDRLVVVYGHGEMITWSTSDGKKLRTIDARCTVEEATAIANQYVGPGEPRRVPTKEEIAGCGGAVSALLGQDLGLVATTASGVRIRRVDSGAPAAMLADKDLPDQYLTWSPVGRLAMANLYGAVALWSPGDRSARLLVPPSPSGPIDPHITSNGRFVTFQVDRRDFAWDLVAKKQLSLPAGFLSLSSDGKIAARRASDAVELQDIGTGAVVLRHPLPNGDTAWVQFPSRGKKALLTVQHYPALALLICDLEASRCTPATFASGQGARAISGDGRWVAAEAQDHTLHVWEASSGKSVLDVGKNIRSVAFSPGGDTFAWIEHPDPKVRRVKAKASRFGGGGDAKVQEIEVEGWPTDIATSADGSEIWVLLEGSLHRWKPGVDTGVEIKETELHGARRMQLSDDGKAVLLTGYDRITVRSTGAGVEPLAVLYPLLSGGFLTVSHAGAVDGSAEAPEHVATRVTRKKEVLVFDGVFGWDAAHVEGVFARALAGQDVEPPVPGANGSSVVGL